MAVRLQSESNVSSGCSVAPVAGGLLQRKCACCSHALGVAARGVWRGTQLLGLQTKLKISEPGDIPLRFAVQFNLNNETTSELELSWTGENA
jgi:hypothetical protein